ncbi:ACN9 family protein [Ancylostoma duodenale]|uniref:Succinate dehydrogenase assembly factor 3 n=1 Tax=Ancylostoma duodenale TaxID=51022 RepID=A0A0C2D375_9BILA|nr:ACN9 family protein [Ancylostoma duodenale]
MSAQKAVKALARPERYPLYLYKRILRLHYGLPPPARLMGDSYVKDEFRRHKDASPEHTAVFINEWTNYCVTLSKQLSSSGIVKGFIGKDLEPEKLDSFAEEQLRQLLDLKIESERMKKGEVPTESAEPADSSNSKETSSNQP